MHNVILKWCTFVETFPLLFCFAITNAARKKQTQLWKTQMHLRKIHKRSCTAFRKLMCVQTQRSSEEAFNSWKSSDLWHKLHHKHILEKHSESWHHFLGRIPYLYGFHQNRKCPISLKINIWSDFGIFGCLNRIPSSSGFWSSKCRQVPLQPPCADSDSTHTH